MSLPSRYNNTEYPGAKSRFDDFNVPHIAQTLTVHFTANFLSFHRYFVWTFERALRDECGYTGYQPYWNWGKWAYDPINSPLFDGGVGSLSGNGEFEPHNFTNGLKDGDVADYIPPGSGGGCVTTGPFANYTVNLGPISPTLEEPEVVAVNSTYDYNPRCMKRDISSWVSSRWTTEQNVTDLLTQWDNIIDFQDNMQATNMTGNFGVHGGGHFTFQGDPAGVGTPRCFEVCMASTPLTWQQDIYSAPGDPAFWLHHGQIDRVWWIWQNQDPESRTSAFGGTITSKNEPPSRNGTLNDTIDVGVNGDIMEIALAMSSVGMTGGPFCYVYV